MLVPLRSPGIHESYESKDRSIHLRMSFMTCVLVIIHEWYDVQGKPKKKASAKH